MSIELIILVVISFLFLVMGHYKRDYTTLLFSSISFFLCGLNAINRGIDGFSSYSESIGILFIGYGMYIGFRSSIELIREGLNSGRKKRRK